MVHMKGYAGHILTLDLDEQTYGKRPLDKDVARRCIGGKGMGARLLLDNARQGIDPLSPDNVLILTVGPLTGTKAPTTNRYGAFFKSPLTGIWGESYCGGHLGPHIKRSRFDAVVVKGRAKRPTYVSILDGGVAYHDASGLWGEDTRFSEEAIRKDIGEGKARVMTIGPAGERMVRYACAGNDYYRQLGRTGVGAVMGSKNLKGIAFLGTRRVELDNEERFDAVVKEVLARIPKDGPMTKFGTPNMVNIQNAMGAFPTHYWQKGFLEAHGAINAPAMAREILDKNRACWNCPVACGKMSSVKDGKYEGSIVEGPEYETIFAFGGLCEIADMKALAKINEVCDLLGMDTITAGNVIGFAMRAYELGRLDSPIPIKFGDDEVVLKLIGMIARREGLGNVLADGVRAAAKRLGAEDIAVHVKGLEPPGYDPRGYNGMALSYAVGVRSADHLRSTVYLYEMRNVCDGFMVEGKAAFVKNLEDKLAIIDSMVLCCFVKDA